jgi:hypothetical protein
MPLLIFNGITKQFRCKECDWKAMKGASIMNHILLDNNTVTPEQNEVDPKKIAGRLKLTSNAKIIALYDMTTDLGLLGWPEQSFYGGVLIASMLTLRVMEYMFIVTKTLVECPDSAVQKINGEKEVWKKINEVLKLRGFNWLSIGKDSCCLKLLPKII